MSAALRIRRAAGPAALAAAVWTGGLAAQDEALRGRVLEAGEPVAGATVVLHSVDRSGGQALGTAVTAEDGSFELPLPVPLDTAAVYFAATRYEGRLFIGPPVRAPWPLPAEYVVAVGAGVPDALAAAEAAAAPALPAAATAQEEAKRWFARVLVAGVAAVSVLLAWVWWRRRNGGEVGRRRLLFALASLDEAQAADPAPAEEYRRRRAALVARLAGRPGGDSPD